jgi:hypothetical protein
MTKKRPVLEFENLPSIDSHDIFIRLDRSVDKRFQELGFLAETYERAQSALMFFFQTSDEDAPWRNDARIRAGLNEFYSMEDAARRDFRRAKVGVKPSDIKESRSPLVHLMYVLRHVNVHTRPVPTRIQNITVISQIGETHEFSYDAVIIDAVSVNDLHRCREVKDYYDISELQIALNWMLNKQQVFGVSEIFRAGVNIYSNELMSLLG